MPLIGAYDLYSFMIKKLHYIKQDYPSNAENFCLKTLKLLYPDFEFMAWRPSSSPIKILYDHGGFFVGPYIYAVNPLPESYFGKSFFVFNNVFETTQINPNLICYSDTQEAPILREFMEKGVEACLKERGFQNDFKVGLAEKEQNLDGLNIYPKSLLSFDRKSREISTSYFMDMNFNLEKVNGIHLHYMIVDENSDSNKVFAVIENYTKLEVKNENHYLLFINKGGNDDLVSRMTTMLIYHCNGWNKRWGIINTLDEDVIPEYIGRKFDNLLSCEKIRTS